MSLVNLAHVCSHLQNASKARLGLTSIPVSKLHVALMLGLQKQGFISSLTLGGPSPPKPVLLQPPPRRLPTLEERHATKLMAELRKARKLQAKKESGYTLQPEQLEQVSQIGEMVKLLEDLGFDESGEQHGEMWPESLRDAYPKPEAAAHKALLGAWRAKNPGRADGLEPRAAVLEALREFWRAKNPEMAAEMVEPAIENALEEAESGREKSLEWTYKEKVPTNANQRRLWVGLKYWKNEPVLNQMRLISKPTRRIWVNSEDLAKITRGRESAFVKGLTRTGECMFVTTDRGIMEARECVEKKLGGMVLCRVI